VSAFQKEDGPQVMLLSLKAGGVGITLTAADHIYILDPWWNPAAEAQAVDLQRVVIAAEADLRRACGGER
jgi:SNF2 family DNA or RNA helicase